MTQPAGKSLFSEGVEDLLRTAHRVTKRFGHAEVELEHLLLAALEPVGPLLGQALSSARVEAQALRGALQASFDGVPSAPGSLAEVGVSERVRRLLESSARASHGRADAAAGERGGGMHDVLLAAFAEAELSGLLRARGIDAAALRTALAQKPPTAADTSALASFTTDLTERARSGELDPVFGRDTEIRQVIQTLCRKTKNNPLLIGEPGVGKTAIVEGLAQRIADGHVPEHLLGHRVLSLDVGSLLAGTRYRGQLEERLKELVRHVAELGNIVLFVDELHTLIGAGGDEGGADAANLLKPALSRGELCCVGATTLAEYRKRIEKDAAFSRRFQVVSIEEPREERALTILRGLCPTYEAHHRVRISDEAVVAAVRLSVRYLSERFLPDKAIDLLDQAAAARRTELSSRPERLERMSDSIRSLSIEAAASKGSLDEAARERAERASSRAAELREELRTLDAAWLEERELLVRARQAEEALTRAERQRQDAVAASRFADVAQLEHRVIPEAKAQLALAQSALPGDSLVQGTVTEADVSRVVSALTGVPLANLAAEERQRLMELEATLGGRVVGQAEAVSRVSRAVRRSRAKLKDPRRPIASFLLAGPTGVGKTELCKALAEVVYGDARSLIRMDMSEYMEKHAAARLVGAPPGYLGFEEGGELTNRVRRKPYCVLLLDEVEKAHPDVFNLLLQVLDDGHLTDSSGRQVDFKNALIMLTTNLGSGASERVAAAPGLDRQARTLAAVKGHFRPEFVNRLDDIVVFEPLAAAALEPIVHLHLEQLRRLLAEDARSLDVSDDVVQKLARDGYDSEYGARPLRRLIQVELIDPIADRIVRGELLPGQVVEVRLKGEELTIAPRAAATPPATS